MTTIQTMLLKWGVILTLMVTAFVSGCVRGEHQEQAKLEKFEGGVQALGEAQIARNKVTEAQQKQTLQGVNDELVKKVADANAASVANYMVKYPRGVRLTCPGSGPVSSVAPSQPADDAGTGERVAQCQPEFIKACGRDAARLRVWIDWATGNHIPVSMIK